MLGQLEKYVNPYLTPYASKNFKWIRDLHLKKRKGKYGKKTPVNFSIIWAYRKPYGGKAF